MIVGAHTGTSSHGRPEGLHYNAPNFSAILRIVAIPRTVERCPSLFSNTAFEIFDSPCLIVDSQYSSRPRTWKLSAGVLTALRAFTDVASGADRRNATLNATDFFSAAGENGWCAATAVS